LLTLHILVILAIAVLVYVGASVLLGVIPREDYLAVYRAIRHKAQPTSSPSTNDLPETPVPANYADGLLEDELAITMKRPAVRPQSMQQTSLAQQGRIVPINEENSGNNGGVVG